MRSKFVRTFVFWRQGGTGWYQEKRRQKPILGLPKTNWEPGELTSFRFASSFFQCRAVIKTFPALSHGGDSKVVNVYKITLKSVNHS